MAAFQVPLHFEDLALAGAEETYGVYAVPAAPAASVDELLGLVRGHAQQWWQPLSQDDVACGSPFGIIYTLLQKFKTLNSPNQQKAIVNLVNDGLRAFTSTPGEQIFSRLDWMESVKIAVFIGTSLCSIAEQGTCHASACMEITTGKLTNKGSKQAWSWGQEERTALLSSLLSVLEITDEAIVRYDVDLEDIHVLVMRMGGLLLESNAMVKDKSAIALLITMLGVLSRRKDHAEELAASLLHIINRVDQRAAIITDVMFNLYAKHGQSRMIDAICAAIGALPQSELVRDSQAARNTGELLAEMAARRADLMAPSLPLLMRHFQGDAYLVRNGLVVVLAHLAIYELRKLREGTVKRANKETEECIEEEENVGLEDSAPKSEQEVHLKRCEAYVGQILERCRDSNAFCRSRTLQMLALLVEEQSLPIVHLKQATEIACGRLEDRAAIVRKNALHLLSSLMRANPFGPTLARSHYEQRRKELQAAVESTSRESSKCSGDIGVDENLEAGENQSTVDQTKALLFYQSAVQFLNCLHGALPKLYLLLRSTNVTDVVEAVQVFVVGLKFGVEGTQPSICRMLVLVLSREKAVQTACVNAYRELLFPSHLVDAVRQNAQFELTNQTVSSHDALSIIRGLISMLNGATSGEVTCIETLMCELQLNCSVFESVLYDILSGKVPQMVDQPSSLQAACLLLGMTRGPSFAASEVRRELLNELICKSSRGATTNDFIMMHHVAQAVSKLFESSLQGQLTRSAPLENFSRLVESMADALCVAATPGIDVTPYLAASEELMNAVYIMSARPHAVLDGVIRRLAKQIAKSMTSQQVVETSRSLMVAQFVFIIGHVAMRELIHVELEVGQLKKKQEAAFTSGTGTNADLEHKMGLSHSLADDSQFEAILSHAEDGLFSNSSPVGKYAPLIVKLASTPSSCEYVQACAVLSLAKMMAAKASFCKAHLQLLFSVLKSSDSSAVRANVAVALGDLAFRFPNMLEPWTISLYGCLEDRDVKVRKNALTVLAHLILNDMIKARGQIVGLALCLEDTDGGIVELARLFFYELARKGGSVIYNSLPDMMSCLTTRPDVSEAQFKSVMKFLIGFLNKDRHIEGTVEKLCLRFRGASSPEEWHRIVYCLGLLPLSERALKRLVDMFRTFADKLHDDHVFGAFMTMCARSSKLHSKSPEARALIEALEFKLDAVRKATSTSSARQATDTAGESGLGTTSMTGANHDMDFLLSSVAQELESISLDGQTRAAVASARKARRKGSSATPAKNSKGKENVASAATSSKPQMASKSNRQARERPGSKAAPDISLAKLNTQPDSRSSSDSEGCGSSAFSNTPNHRLSVRPESAISRPRSSRAAVAQLRRRIVADSEESE